MALGGDDPRRTREIVLAMYNFLINKPKNTRRVYRTAIRQFLDLTRWKDVRRVTYDDAMEYKRWLIDRNYSNSTICTRLAAVTSFFGSIAQPMDGPPLLSRNPFSPVDRKDVAPTPKPHSTPLAWDDFDKMLKATPIDPIGIRDRAVLIFMAYTGRGRTEIARLTIADIDTTASPRKYTITKRNGTQSTWALPDLVYQYMRAHWISSGRLPNLRPESGVFGSVKVCPLTKDLDPERPLHNDLIAKIVKMAAKRAGLDARKINVHGLRHMAARDMNAEVVRLRDIDHFMGRSMPNAHARFLGQLRPPPKGMLDDVRRIQRAAVALTSPIIDAA